jgi:hypothetical protein
VIFWHICKIAIFGFLSSKVDAKLVYGQLTAGFLKLNYWDFIYISEN